MKTLWSIFAHIVVPTVLLCGLLWFVYCADSPTEPVIENSGGNGYIRGTEHFAFWTTDHTRIFTYSTYVNLNDKSDDLENVGIAVTKQEGEIFLVKQGGFFKEIDNNGYATGEVKTAEVGQELYVYSYIAKEDVPDSVSIISWINLEWSRGASLGSVSDVLKEDRSEKSNNLRELWRNRVAVSEIRQWEGQ